MPPILTEKRRVCTFTKKDVIIETEIQEDLCVKTGDPNHPYTNINMHGTWKIAAILASERKEKVLDGPTCPFHMPPSGEENLKLARFLMKNKLERGDVLKRIMDQAIAMFTTPHPNGAEAQFRD
jgi:hypothetical protein